MLFLDHLDKFYLQVLYRCTTKLFATRLLHLFSVQRDEGAGLWQVDLDMMDILFTSLVEYLQLENAYNVFILNPLRVPGRAKYGYRCMLANKLILFYYCLQFTSTEIYNLCVEYIDASPCGYSLC